MKLFNLRARAKKDMAVELCLKKLYEIEQELEFMLVSHDPIKEYDHWNMRLDSIDEKIHIFDDVHDKRVENAVAKLKDKTGESRLYAETMCDKCRKNILTKLENVDDVYNKRVVNVEDVLGVMTYIKEKLNLDKFGSMSNISYGSNLPTARGLQLVCNVSSDQMISFQSCITDLIEGDFKKAIHSFLEFIENKNYNKDKPFNHFELFCISVIINQFSLLWGTYNKPRSIV